MKGNRAGMHKGHKDGRGQCMLLCWQGGRGLKSSQKQACNGLATVDEASVFEGQEVMITLSRTTFRYVQTLR